jgi:nicotinate phosphoribosyltransferase
MTYLEKAQLTIEQNPFEQGRLSSGLDYYKPTMSQVALEREPDAEVTFTLKNRGEQRLADYINLDDLRARLDEFRENGWSQDELEYLADLRKSDGAQVFGPEFVEYLATHELPPVSVTYDEAIDDIAVNTTGVWPMVTFWETVVMSEINEMYFENYLLAKEINPLEVYEEGDQRLSEKIAILQQNPNIKFADFGTRRHFSLRWQKYVLERLIKECPENIVGTSNVALARSLDIRPIGTFAHETLMVYAGLADERGEDIRASHNKFLYDWFDFYGEDLSIALTDTFGSEFFLADFTPEQARKWRGMRHDSGDPYKFGEDVIKFYENLDIDPTVKTIVFSDGLDIDTIVELHKHFEGRVRLLFGWGTTLTNDLGLPALNIVMKATKVNGIETVKLSDNTGKHTGSEEQIRRYENVFRAN